jgi:preprotein translocase subunit SecA
MMRQVERYILLNAIDQRWKDHLYAIDSLKHGIHLRAYAQQDPKNIYKQEGFALFQKLFATIEDEVSSLVMRIEVRRSENAPAAAAPRAPIRPAVPASMAFDLARRQQPRPGNPPRPS